MMKIYYLVIFLLGCATVADAQYIRYTVQLTDKKGSSFSLSKPTEFLSSRSVQRRIRQKISLDSSDLPVSKVYIDSLAKISGVTVINSSKWLNNILVQAPDSATVVKIRSLPFVKRLIPVAVDPATRRLPVINRIYKEKNILPLRAQHSSGITASNTVLEDSIDYGNNYPQVHIHEGEYLHKLGFRGQGMMIAILDAGFQNYQSNPAFDSLRANNQILGEYDFVNNETDVNMDDSHGANCFSIMASNLPGVMVGTAPKASYYLFKSEDVYSETPVEEQYWIVAAERADSAGADLISSSLGYAAFDDTSLSLTYNKRDGKTAPITIAANMAFDKGMIVTNSSGNSGESPDDYKYVMCPADGDNVLAIGAIGTNGTVAPWSSGGPTGAGRLKPDLVSVGLNTVFVNIHGATATGSGTSYSNPNLAGLVACLWQAFSDFTNAEIIDAIERSADKYNTPDERYGHGIPNMRVAYQILEAERQAKLNEILTSSYITAYPVPFSQSFTVYLKAPTTANASIRIIDVHGKILQVRSVQVQKDNYYNFSFGTAISSSGIYFLQYDDGKNKTILKLARL